MFCCNVFKASCEAFRVPTQENIFSIIPNTIIFRLLSQMKFNRSRVKCFFSSRVHTPHLYLFVCFVVVCEIWRQRVKTNSRKKKLNFDIKFEAKVNSFEANREFHQLWQWLNWSVERFQSQTVSVCVDKARKSCENITKNKNGCRVTLNIHSYVVVLFFEVSSSKILQMYVSGLIASNS